MQPYCAALDSFFHEKTDNRQSPCILVCPFFNKQLHGRLSAYASIRMKWFSHRIFAVGVAAMCKFDISGIASCFLGSTIPDSIDFFLTKLGFSFNKIHRKHSHAWIWYAVSLLFVYAVIIPRMQKDFQELMEYEEIIPAFFIGIFSHIFLDMLTVKGVPRFINPDKKFAVKLVRTNTYSEYIFIFTFFVTACFYLYLTKNQYLTVFVDFVYNQL